MIGLIREYRKVLEDLEQAESLLDDPELKEMAKAEREALLARKEALEKELERHLLPKDPMDERDAIVEIRAGTGGGGRPLRPRPFQHVPPLRRGDGL